MSERLTASNLIRSMNALKDRDLNYVNSDNQGRIRIIAIHQPEGPVEIRRWNPSKLESCDQARTETISSNMLWRLANALATKRPVNVDRVFGGSYNTRSALEAILAHTPEFYFAYPDRIDTFASTVSIKKGHKHLIWMPNTPHEAGVMKETQTSIVISEIPTEATYDGIQIFQPDANNIAHDTELARRHAQIQFALLMIGRTLRFKTWIALNDRGIVVKDVKIGEMDGVLSSLNDVKLISAFDAAINAGKLIDCIWFRNDKYMPAVMEIEHSTGVKSGLTRMLEFKKHVPPVPTRWTIVAPDDDREAVVSCCGMEQFKELGARYFPYSAVEELYSLCQRRILHGFQDEFIDSFIETAVN